MNPFCSPRLAHLSTTCNLLRGLLLGTCGFLKAPLVLLPLRNGIRVAIRVGNRSNSGAARRFCINKSEENVEEGGKEGKEFHEFPHDSLASCKRQKCCNIFQRAHPVHM